MGHAMLIASIAIFLQVMGEYYENRWISTCGIVLLIGLVIGGAFFYQRSK